MNNRTDKIKGRIFSIEEFSLFDGEGIRTTVFFKGCPLKCVWCHNPEGISPEKELMVKKSQCLNCGKCAEVCNSYSECNSCGNCVDECPKHIRHISGQDFFAGELAEKLKKIRIFTTALQYRAENLFIKVSF